MKETRTLTQGAPKTLPQIACGPVAMVRAQKVGFKYKKPTAQVGRRTCSWVPRVGGGQIPGKPRSADRRLFHSRIFFPQLNVFSALPRWKSSPAFDCKHIAAERMSANALQMKDYLQSGRPLGSLARKTSSRVIPQSSIYFLAYRYQGAVKLRKVRGGTGRLGKHFFTQNSGFIFLAPAASPDKSRRSNRKAQSNQRRCVQKTSRN